MADGVLSDARIAGLNWAEVVRKALSAGAGQLWPHTRQQGLSLGDRARAQLPLELDVQIVRWHPLALGEVQDQA